MRPMIKYANETIRFTRKYVESDKKQYVRAIYIMENKLKIIHWFRNNKLGMNEKWKKEKRKRKQV